MEIMEYTCSECESMHRGTYDLPATCTNCGTQVIVRLSKSHPAYSSHPTCPTCGYSQGWKWGKVSDLQSDEEATNADAAR